jgi:hypothetical protein
MDEFFFSQSIDGKKALCIGPITRREAGNLYDSYAPDDASGLYLFVMDRVDRDSDIKIIAKMSSVEMACQFANMVRAGKVEVAEAELAPA